MSQPNDPVATILQQWRRERPDLDVTPMGPVGRLRRSAVQVQKRLDTVFARHQLASWEFDLLATLRRSGEPYRLAPTVLFSSLMLTSGAMTRQLHQLEKRGLIQRQINPADARSVLVQLSAEGLALIDSAVGEHVDNLHRLTSTLDATELAQLDSLLGKWMAGLEGEGEKGRDM
ncbi:MarR family winged helix-turn-helix transcriptional regulator [Rivihabitans pingtungensis]|jgi:DNA-binding MarR family transcriptional regulator|uniref:MarR family winged helix-turn-helix transcriptional regulator n=1 Tax=Rivihabitans pingtungensis TaxID=1054498 RepID=UPI002355DDEF|nr:MarR family transcriptional regulator [Rivihabitans pingtungensis]MCK6435729.1 MarR family transcriptional regulator [Rivihabitans pingtungensis]